MAIFGKDKESIVVELLKSKDREVELLKEQVVDLKAREERNLRQIERLQEALIAVQSPLAYTEMKYDERASSFPDSRTPEDKERTALMEKTTRDWFSNLEGPTFKNADEMTAIMSKLYGDSVGSEPVHPNEES